MAALFLTLWGVFYFVAIRTLPTLRVVIIIINNARLELLCDCSELVESEVLWGNC